jgi:hypothetical protein
MYVLNLPILAMPTVVVCVHVTYELVVGYVSSTLYDVHTYTYERNICIHHVLSIMHHLLVVSIHTYESYMHTMHS